MFLRWLNDVRQKLITGRQGSRNRTIWRKKPARRLGVEALEDRTVPATVSWINAAGGDWGTPANWSTGTVPGAGDDVVIQLPGSVAVTHTGNVTDTVHSLTNSDSLAVSAGIIDAATVQNAGTITVGSLGMVAATTYTQTAGATLLQGGRLGSFLPPESNALSFNGSDYVQAPSSSTLQPTTQMTVEAWVDPNSLANQMQGIAGSWNDQQGNFRTNLLWIQSSHFAFYVSHDGSDFPNAVSTTTLQSGQWYHVAGTFDGTYIRLYVNGALEASTYAPGPIDANSLPFNVGRVDGGGGTPKLFDGQIADLSFWSVARSQSQIQSDMSQPLSGSETGLAAYWPLDAVADGAVADQSGNQNTGATSNPALTATPVSGGAVNIQGGTFSGFGTINGDLTNAGAVDLGGAAGTLTIRGNYTQTAAASLALKVGGTTAGAQFDQLNVSGNATLGGTLNVSLSNGFNPLQGETFDDFNFASASGSFAAVNLPTSDGVTAFTTSFAATNLTLVGATIPPTSSVDSLPTYSGHSFTVSWTGQDNLGGSGVASFDVYVSDNGGAFVPFVTGTAATSATFTGQNGHTYGFYSVATDAIGNREATPSGAEATTMVPLQVSTSASLASSAPSGSTYGQSVTFTATVTPGLTVFGTPSGTVQFLVDGADLGSPVALSNGMASISTAALSAGQRDVTANYTSDTSDFGASNGALTQTVSPALLTVTANDATKVYGTDNPTFTDTITGFVNGDGAAVVSGTASLTTTATASSGVGAYAITAAQGSLSAANYTFAFAKGTLTVTPAGLTVTANSTNKTYGATTSFTGTEFSTSGLVHGDTVTSATLTSTGAAATAAVGSYAIVPSAAVGTGLGNYTITYDNGALTVTPATLTVTANGATKVYGAANPTFTDTITGFVNGDGAAVVSGTASLTTTATASSGVGAYAITAAQGSLSAANYTFTFVNGTLRVSPAVLTVTANDTTRKPGRANPTFTDTITGLVNGDTTAVVRGAACLTTKATVESPPGAYTITAAQGSLSAANYTFTFVNGTLTISPHRQIVVSLVSSADASVAGKAVTFKATVAHASGTITFFDGDKVLATVVLKDGTASYTTAALAAGTHAITAVYKADPDAAADASSVLIQNVKAAAKKADADPPKKALLDGDDDRDDRG